jgi:hypothetical protein
MPTDCESVHNCYYFYVIDYTFSNVHTLSEAALVFHITRGECEIALFCIAAVRLVLCGCAQTTVWCGTERDRVSNATDTTLASAISSLHIALANISAHANYTGGWWMLYRTHSRNHSPAHSTLLKLHYAILATARAGLKAPSRDSLCCFFYYLAGTAEFILIGFWLVLYCADSNPPFFSLVW